ncbi:MAG: DUF1294 domain-containing protein [Clostridia bacterium]
MFDNTIPAIDFSKVFTIPNFIVYLVMINMITFFAMWLDKRKAQRGKWRTSEQTLFVLVLLGGGIGGIAGMYTFRHKTQKPRFVVGFPAILIFEIVVLLYFFLK